MNMSVYPPIDAATAVPNPLDIPVIDLFPRQSRTVEKQLPGTDPQPNFDCWFQFIWEGQCLQCLVDEYTAISRRSTAGQGHFPEMVDKGQKMMLDDSRGLTTIGVRHGEVLLPNYVGTELQMIGRSSRTLDSMVNSRRLQYQNPQRPRGYDAADPFRVASIPIPTAAFFRKQVDVQWISEGPDCLLASSINFIIVLWHGYYLALLLRHPIPRSHTPSAALYSPPSLSTPSTTNRGASDISWERQEARCVLAWCRPTAVLHSDLSTLRVLTPISSTLVRLPVTDGL
ncbi:hypothetical protein C8F01DRAFT_480210 [Mycena amicta]|nr:hypothetical protein C8F01DRAFT_480210 [Mycena amicta]